MAAFLYLPAPTGAGTGRRVDFANIASLFAEIEEPAAARPDGRLTARLLALAMILLLAAGDMVLVSRPDAAALCPSAAMPAAHAAVTTL